MVVAVFLVIVASAPLWAFPQMDVVKPNRFGYRRTGQDECSVCFSEADCFVLHPVRCEFYMETTKILQPDFHNPVQPTPSRKTLQFKTEVDALIYSTVENGFADRNGDECIPFISTYTNCDKENICMGCKSCECNEYGQWNCTISQKCRPDLINVIADHETLRTIINSLDTGKSSSPSIDLIKTNRPNQKGPEGETPNSRRKRSIHKWLMREDSWEDSDDEISHAKLAAWISEEPTLDLHTKARQKSYQHDYQYEKSKRYLEPRKSMEHHQTKDKFVRSLVNSLIHDTLPQVFKEAVHDFETNRVRRWIKSKANTDSSNKITPIANNEKRATAKDSKVTTETPKEDTENVTKITFEELYEWMNIVHPKVYIDNTTEVRANQLKQLEAWKTAINEAPNATEPQTNPDYLAFEEVLSSIASDNRTYTRRRPLPSNKHVDEYINMEDSKYYLEDDRANSNEKYVEEKNIDPDDAYALFRGTTEDTVSTTNDTYDMEMLNNKIDNFDTSISNIMKREISTSNEGLLSNNGTTTTNNNSNSSSLQGLKNDVLEPLNKILEDKQKEIEELTKIKESLKLFLKSHKDNKNKTKESILSFYKLEILPHHHHSKDGRRTNSTLLDKYTLKLKRDIYEVIRDIIGIRQQYSDSKKVPQELIYLIKAMKHYIHKSGFRPKKDLTSKVLRRKNNKDTIPVKKSMETVLKLLDSNMPKNDVLGLLSPHSARIIKRFMGKNYENKFEASGLRVYDPTYNLTNDLKNIGSQWYIMTTVIQHSPIEDQLHNMKRLHLILSVDIAKLTDALALIAFARSRRMVPVDEAEVDRVVDNINKNIDQIAKKFNEITLSKSNDKIKPANIEQHKKKESFLSQIKKLLQSSKNDIVKLFKKKVPNTEIVKEIARKHAEDVTRKKLEDTMQKWQTTLHVASHENDRVKRSLNRFSGLSRRIKNIIPKYLRGKVHVNPGRSKNKKSILPFIKGKGNATGGANGLRKKNTVATKGLEATTISPSKRKTIGTKLTTTSTLKPATSGSTVSISPSVKTTKL